ncbi:MAG: TIGR03545 family protein [Bacteroidetes bacterium]|nr:TIGR03545 family protein [Bacteroidota bacterium]
MRKRFWLVVLIPLIIFVTVVYLFINSWIESGIEYAAEEVVGAEVEINNLRIGLSPIGIEWEKIQVANPRNTWENLFETGIVKFSMDFGQLLRGKYIIEQIEVNEFIIGSKRKTDGAINRERNKRAVLAGNEGTFSELADKAFKKTIETPPLFDLVKLKNGFNADSLLKALDMSSLKNIDSLEKDIQNLTDDWATIKNDFEIRKQKVIEVEQQISSINPAQLKDVQKISEAITAVDNAQKTVSEISTFINEKSGTVQTNLQNLTASIGNIDNFIKDDFEKLKNMARLPSFKAGGMAQLLVGSEMYKRIKNYLYWADAARTNIEKYSPEPEYEYPPRMQGQDIEFPAEKKLPKFWIKNVKISGGNIKQEGETFIQAKGTAGNISDNQLLTGMPLTFSLEGSENERRTIKLSGLFDRRKNIPYDEISANLSGVPVGEFNLGNSNFLPAKITDAVMTTGFQISLIGNKIDVNSDFYLTNLNLLFEAEPKNIVERLVREVLINVKDFKVSLRLWNTGGNLDLALATDLDEKLMNKISSVVGEEINKLQSELKRKFDSYINAELNKFNEMYKSKISAIQNQLGAYNILLSDKINIIDNKEEELLAQLEKAKKGFLEDKIKSIFK